MADQPSNVSDGMSTPLKWTVIILIIVVFIIVIVLIAVYSSGTSESSSETTTKAPGYGKDDKGVIAQTFTFDKVAKLKPSELKSGSVADLRETCKSHQKRLAVPRTKSDLNTLFESIKQYHKEAQCDDYALGIMLNPDLRYQSLDGKEKWPSLSSNQNPGVPAANESRDCLRAKVASEEVEVVESLKCDDITDFDCLLLHDDASDCGSESKAECLVPVTLDDEVTTLLEAWESATESQGKTRNIVFIDQNYTFDEMKKMSDTECYAFDVKYVFDFVDVYTRQHNEVIKTDIIQDPEWECVKVQAETMALSRVQCDNIGCPICF
uniref:C-type lectin domain-containing protein n=1 Tax=Strigamia maritima TaxID=126957 RepID=T1ISY5_STRMM